jgi:transcriptional regulator with XRE-family HTH domain
VKYAEFRKTALRKPGVRAAFEALGPDFELLRALLDARTKAGMSQADVAARMGTQAPSVARLESALRSAKHSPTIGTLRRYADAVGCDLQIRLVSRKSSRVASRVSKSPGR